MFFKNWLGLAGSGSNLLGLLLLSDLLERNCAQTLLANRSGLLWEQIRTFSGLFGFVRICSDMFGIARTSDLSLGFVLAALDLGSFFESKVTVGKVGRAWRSSSCGQDQLTVCGKIALFYCFRFCGPGCIHAGSNNFVFCLLARVSN
jgi:hypothetical protein